MDIYEIRKLIRGVGKDEQMRLWTVQTEGAWNEFQKKGVLLGDGRRILPDFRFAYRWLMKEMKLRLPSYSGRYPIWAWCHKPDLRSSSNLSPGTRGVRIGFRVSMSRFLLSSFDAWSALLTGSYLALTEQEDVVWEKYLSDNAMGQRHYRDLPPYIQQEIEQSWERIFDLEAMHTSDWIGPIQYIQAVIERIHMEEVTDARIFVQRRFSFDPKDK